jgi:putative endonuclease
MKVVARGYRPPSGAGEIDLVAWDSATLVFVEVKSRQTAAFGSPDRNVDEDKRRALLAAARDYARRAGAPWDAVRFDLVTVVFGDPPAIDHRPGAFRYT